jgi:hypothetical protein
MNPAIGSGMPGFSAGLGIPPNTYAWMPQSYGTVIAPLVDPNRPTGAAVGTLYLDALLERAIVWDGTNWHDAWNGQVV